MTALILRRSFWLVSLLLIALMSPAQALSTGATGRTIHVPADYAKIQDAVNAASNGDTVLVADGTYSGDGNRDIDFYGKSLTITSQNGPTKTTVDCGGYASTDGSGNHRGFYLHSDERAATIGGFTVKNGYETSISGIIDSGFGSGIFNYNKGNGTITLTNCAIIGNTATYRDPVNYRGAGSVVYNCNDDGGTITLINCTAAGNTCSGNTNAVVFDHNRSTGSGKGTITLTGCAVSGNTGTGIYNRNVNGGHYNGSTITLTNCTVSKNTARFDGRGVYNENYNSYYGSGGTIDLINCIISENTVYGYGGGIYNLNIYGDGSTITLTNCIIAKNTAQYEDNYNNSGGDSGGVYNQNSGGKNTITLKNCNVIGNIAQHAGGGIYNNNNYTGLIIIANCDVSQNTAEHGGGGDYNYNYDSHGAITLTNCILYQDTGGEIANDPDHTTNVAVTYSDILGGYAGTGNIDADPQFVNAATGDLHLKPGSPCLGAGTATGAPPTDLDGTQRPDPPSMGAYELAAPATITGFTLSPNQVDAPGPTVTAEVTASGTFSQVYVSCTLQGLTGPPPTFKLALNGNHWTASFPTYFLKLAGTNPVTFTAYGIRADGTTTTKTATLRLGPVVPPPSLALYLSPVAKKVSPDQVVGFSVVVSNITQTPALLTTITVTLPANMDLVSAPGFKYDGDKTLTCYASLLALPSVAKAIGSNLAILSFSARVKANAPQKPPS